MDKDQIDWDGGTGDYRGLIRYLSGLKNEHAVLSSDGASFEIVNTGNKNIFSFIRETDDEKLICIYNLSKRPQEDVDISALGFEGGEIILKGEGGTYEESGELPEGTCSFEPWEFSIILVSK